MDKKILIVLFATILYNGVVFASPVEVHQISNATHFEVRPTENGILKVENTTAFPSADPVNVSKDITTLAPLVTAPGLKNETSHAVSESSSVAPLVNKTNVTEDTAVNKTATVVSDGKTDVNKTDAKSVVKPINKQVTETAAAAKDFTDMPMPISGKATTSAPNASAKVPAKNATSDNISKTSVATPKASPPTPVSTPSASVKDNIVIEHTVPSPVQEKHFDGPSFIGGIVLTIGLTAIGFIAFKYYKSGKIDMNYRTL